MHGDNIRNNREKVWELLFMKALNPIFVVDENGNYIDANPAALDFVEMGRDELLKMQVWDFAPPGKLGSQKEQHSPFASSCTLETEYFINGRIKTLLLNVVPFEINGEKILYGIGHDITERKLTMQNLRLTQFSVDHMGDAVFWIKPDGGLEYVNHMACSSLGYTREELLMMSIFDIDPNFPVEKWEDHWNEVKNAKFMKFESIHRTKDGELIPAEITVNHLLFDGKEYHCAFARNITERKQAEKTLRESENKLKSAFKAAPIGIGFVTNRIIGWTNDQMSKILEYTQAEMQGMDARVLYESEDEYLRVGREKHGEISKRGIGALETRLKRKDGKVLDIYLSSASIFPNDPSSTLVFTVMDITDRKKAEKALQESRSMFQALTENSPDIIIRLDKDHRFIYVNSIVEKYTGKSPQEYIGNALEEERFDKENSAKIQKRLKKVFKTGKPYEGEYEYTNGSNKIIFNWRLIPETSITGEVKTVLSISRDITEMKRLEEYATQAMRLETAGRISGQVAHDFNNLLGPLTAYPDLIMEGLSAENPIMPLLEDMKMAAEQIAEINQQLLTLGRRGHYNQVVLNLNDVVRQALKRIFPQPNTLVIEKNLAAELMSVKGGSSQILRAVANLISNARDAMEDMGHLTVKTQNTYVDKRTGKFGHIPRGEYVLVTIADTGCGIDPEIILKIFDPFFTTKAATLRKGSGLGLSVVHAVMLDHNGFIDMESVLGEGTTVYLYFPITRDSARAITETEIRGGTEKILVIDDDNMQREVVRRLLGKLGYDIYTVESGEKALQVIKDNSFDLIILDMIMPGGIDGAETYKRILEKRPGQPAIVVSGYAESEKVEEARKLGAQAFIRKPLTLKSIAAEVRKELDREKARG